MSQQGSFSGIDNLVILNSNDYPTTVPGGWHATWGSFSPDGSEIVYGIQGSFPGPYIIDTEGGTPRSLGDPCGHRCGQPFVESAAWSPDGSRIAWLDSCEELCPVHDLNGNYVLSFVNPDGTAQTEVASLPSGGWNPRLSPDGSWLAHSDWDSSGSSRQIFVINADGSGCDDHAGRGQPLPTWSPDGSRSPSGSGETRPREPRTMAADGTDLEEVVGVHPEGAIVWTPVG
jgi:Tol biopolymer transport system component